MSETYTIRLPSRFDFGHHREFSAQVEKALTNAQCKTVVLDFSQVGYLDSAALGLLVLLSKRNTESGSKRKLIIKGAQGVALEILEMANMSKLYGNA